MFKRIRSLLLPVLAVLGTSVALAKGPEQQLGVYDFSKGVDSFHSSLSLPDGFVQDALNVYFDRGAPVEKRQGYTVAFSTQGFAFQSEWSYTDGNNTSWIIVRSSNQITASNLAGSVVKIATTSANDSVAEVNSQGNAYFVDPTQGVYYWNGSATTYVSGSPKGSLITQFHGRIWVAGVAVPNGNQLYGSKYLDGTTWATGPNPNDPVQLTVGLTDNFDNITALYPFLDTLYTTKHYAIYAVYGFDQTNFQISFITSECGCVDGQSIQTFNHGLYFVSLRGVEFFNGYTCQRVSDQVKDKVDVAIGHQSGFQTQSWVQSQTSDWQGGTLTPSGNLSTSISPPALVLSTGTTTDNTNANFNLGTLNNVAVANNQVSLTTNNSGNVNDNDFETTLATDWTFASGNGSTASEVTSATTSGCTVNPYSGSQFLCVFSHADTQTYGFRLLDRNSNLLVDFGTVSAGSACSGWTTHTFTPSSSLIGSRVYFQIYQGVNTVTTNSTYILGGAVTLAFNYAGKLQGGSCPGGVCTYDYAFDDVQNGSSTITTGSFTSRTIDTGVTQSYVLPGYAATVNTSTPTFVLQHSPDSSTWSNLTTSTGTSVLANRYLRYLSTFTISSTDNALSTLNISSFQWTASSGSFQSPIHQTGVMNSFGNFFVQDTLNSGSIVFSICSSTNSNMSAPTSCATQTPNSQITIATGTFIQVWSTFTVTGATQTPTLNSFTVQWFSGNRLPSMASTVWDNRYYLALSTVPADNINDAILVLGQNGIWAPFDIHAGGLTQYKGNLYHADSTGTGNVYLDNQGYNDNGSPILAYIKTKDYSMGNLTEDDFIDSIWPSMDNLGNFNVSSNYYVDRSTTPFALGTMNQNEFGNNASVKLPFPLDSAHQNFGKTLAYQFVASDSNEPWKFYGFREIFHSRPTQ